MRRRRWRWQRRWQRQWGRRHIRYLNVRLDHAVHSITAAASNSHHLDDAGRGRLRVRQRHRGATHATHDVVARVRYRARAAAGERSPRSGSSAGGVLTSEESGAVERRQQREDPPRLVMVGWWVVRRRLIKVFVSGIFAHITWLVRQRWGAAWCAAPRSDASPDCNANRRRLNPSPPLHRGGSDRGSRRLRSPVRSLRRRSAARRPVPESAAAGDPTKAATRAAADSACRKRGEGWESGGDGWWFAADVGSGVPAPAGSRALRCSERITYHDRRHAYPGDCHGACNLFACGGSGSRQGLVVVGEECRGPGWRWKRWVGTTVMTRGAGTTHDLDEGRGASVLARARGVEGLTLLRPGPGCRGGRSHLGLSRACQLECQAGERDFHTPY